ncbi:hypothetical protein [Streptomyces iconiensis]|uniref:Uncharacterized protein n=1 Tax=Streptomyces iconiensis TaxID=1384038 RepID=A0ABT7A0N5_9ACTN|nr:hypothetical protein [Streptomyces iconiensis]MDJ1134619.1 hypothetical protein [Streptomyces iconiensis]
MEHLLANTADITLTVLVLVGLTTLLALPALLGQRREWRVDRQLRDAERGAYDPAPGGGSGNGRREDLVAIHLTSRDTPGTRQRRHLHRSLNQGPQQAR